MRLPIDVNWERRRDPGNRCITSSRKLLAIEDKIFTDPRLTWYGSGVVIIYAVVLATLLFKQLWIIHPGGKIAKIDFCYIWTAGNLAQSSDPARIFDSTSFLAAQLALSDGLGSPFIPYFVYPPTFLFFTYPLGMMPYSTAFVVWIVATFLVYEAAIYRIIPRPAAAILAITPFPVLFNVGLGQNGFLTAGLIGLSLISMERRPWLSGIFFGLLTYKPQFGILFPFALLASRKWCALVSAGAASAVLDLAATIVFGYRGWLAFISSLLLNREASLGEIPGWQPPIVSVFSFVHSAGANQSISWILHAMAAGSVTAIVIAIWARPINFSLKAAALCIGSVLVTPYVLGYDLCILSVAVAFLVKDALARGFLPGERVAMLSSWLSLIFLMVPLIPITISVMLLAFIARRASARDGQRLTPLLPILGYR